MSVAEGKQMIKQTLPSFLDWKRSSGWLESWEVLLWTPIPEMIFFNPGMLLLGTNRFLIPSFADNCLSWILNDLKVKCSDPSTKLTWIEAYLTTSDTALDIYIFIGTSNVVQNTTIIWYTGAETDVIYGIDILFNLCALKWKVIVDICMQRSRE